MPLLEMLAFILAYMVALMFCFCAHEFSHAYVAYKLGDPTSRALGRLTLNPLKHIDPPGFLCLILFGFGWAKPVEVNPLHFKRYKRDMALVSIAGVTSNLILAFVFSGIYFFVSPLLVGSTNLFLIFIDLFLYFMVILNLSLMVFNLLPIYPLDGFNFIKSLTRPNNAFVNFMLKYGTIVLLIFLITPIFDYVYYYVTNGLLWVFSQFWGLFI